MTKEEARAALREVSGGGNCTMAISSLSLAGSAQAVTPTVASFATAPQPVTWISFDNSLGLGNFVDAYA